MSREYWLARTLPGRIRRCLDLQAGHRHTMSLLDPGCQNGCVAARFLLARKAETDAGANARDERAADAASSARPCCRRWLGPWMARPSVGNRLREDSHRFGVAHRRPR